MSKTQGKDFVLRSLQTYTVRYQANCVGILEDEASVVETRMRNEHRWQNRTGAAEANLRCELFDAAGPVLRLVAFHGVYYGRFLETMQGGRFAVLLPTMRSQWPRTLARLRKGIAGIRNDQAQPGGMQGG